MPLYSDMASTIARVTEATAIQVSLFLTSIYIQCLTCHQGLSVWKEISGCDCSTNSNLMDLRVGTTGGKLTVKRVCGERFWEPGSYGCFDGLASKSHAGHLIAASSIIQSHESVASCRACTRCVRGNAGERVCKHVQKSSRVSNYFWRYTMWGHPIDMLSSSYSKRDTYLHRSVLSLCTTLLCVCISLTMKVKASTE